MFQINESFLEGLGVENMGAEEKKKFLEYVQDQIESRIGEKITADMNAEQEDYLAKLSDGEEAVVKEVMMRYPHYADDESFSAIKQSMNSEEEAVAEYALLKWLEENKIDYQEIVKHTIDEIRREIYEDREQILAK